MSCEEYCTMLIDEHPLKTIVTANNPAFSFDHELTDQRNYYAYDEENDAKEVVSPEHSFVYFSVLFFVFWFFFM